MDELATTAEIPGRTAKLAISAGLVAAREVFLDEVWKPRCKETVAWERRQEPRITATLKKTKVPPGYPKPTLAELGVTEDEVGALRVTHLPVDKKRERWKKEALDVVIKVYGSWTIRKPGVVLRAARRLDQTTWWMCWGTEIDWTLVAALGHRQPGLSWKALLRLGARADGCAWVWVCACVFPLRRASTKC